MCSAIILESGGGTTVGITVLILIGMAFVITHPLLGEDFIRWMVLLKYGLCEDCCMFVWVREVNVLAEMTLACI